MSYRIRFVSDTGAESEIVWPGNEESARRHMVELVVSGGTKSAQLLDEGGAIVAGWPDDGQGGGLA